MVPYNIEISEGKNMYCTECGKKNPDNDRFCRYCGTELENQKEIKQVSEEFYKIGFCENSTPVVADPSNAEEWHSLDNELTVDEMMFTDEIDCADLFEGNDERERIMIFELGME